MRKLLSLITLLAIFSVKTDASFAQGNVVQAQRDVQSSIVCPSPGSVRSPASNTPTELVVYNGSDFKLDLYWIDFSGDRRYYKSLQPGDEYLQKTYVGHAWLAVDGQGRCRGGLFQATPGRSYNAIY